MGRLDKQSLVCLKDQGFLKQNPVNVGFSFDRCKKFKGKRL